MDNGGRGERLAGVGVVRGDHGLTTGGTRTPVRVCVGRAGGTG